MGFLSFTTDKMLSSFMTCADVTKETARRVKLNKIDS